MNMLVERGWPPNQNPPVTMLTTGPDWRCKEASQGTGVTERSEHQIFSIA